MTTTFLCVAIIAFAYCAIFVIYSFTCGGIMLFSRRKEAPRPDGRMLHFAVISCARNEGDVIGQLVDSINGQDYPKELYRTYVIAHNCTDATAEVARAHGAEVLVLNQPSRQTKGDALRYGIAELLRTDTDFEAFCVFDADNLVSPSFLSEMNKALTSGADIAQGYLKAKNVPGSWVSGQFEVYWKVFFHLVNMGSYRLSLPCTIHGSGFGALRTAVADTGWDTHTILEDAEFSHLQTMRGRAIVPAPEAVFYDEQPESLHAAFEQRRRWAVGMNQMIRDYFSQELRYTVSRGGGLRGAQLLIELMINPAPLVMIIGCVALAASLALAGASVTQALLAAVGPLILICVLAFAIGLMTVGGEQRRFLAKLHDAGLFSLFVATQFVGVLASLFSRNAGWRSTEHHASANIKEVEKEAGSHA